MKYFLLFLLMSLFNPYSFSQGRISTKDTIYTDSGYRFVGVEIDGVRNGYFQMYSDSILIGEGNYLLGIKEGLWKYYYPNGDKVIESMGIYSFNQEVAKRNLLLQDSLIKNIEPNYFIIGNKDSIPSSIPNTNDSSDSYFPMPSGGFGGFSNEELPCLGRNKPKIKLEEEVKDGLWLYFNMEGRLMVIEEYDNGEYVSESRFGDYRWSSFFDD